jgi:transposase
VSALRASGAGLRPRAGTAAAARLRFTAWIHWVRTEAAELKIGLLEPMRAVADRVERHRKGILAHWQQGLTTAFLEGLNRLFSAVKRKARGYRTKEYQIAMLCFVAGKLEIPCYA